MSTSDTHISPLPELEAFQRRHRAGLVTLVFTDLVGSTRIKQKLGDSRGVELIRRHHELVREILAAFAEGEEISTAGDSFLLVFTKPSDAVRFALTVQARLRAISAEVGQPVHDRIGIHIGEVMVQEDSQQTKTEALYGLQVDVSARVMSLAAGNQILMTRSAFDNARQRLKGSEISGVGALSWINHGPYSLKGIDESIEICEVGEVGVAPLNAPGNSDKVTRVLADNDQVLGWRPAIGLVIPNTAWLLKEKLGEGGFGEVWLAQHEQLKDQRVIKFCFRADRVRSLKRELTLFRLLRERTGSHPNIVAVEDVFLDEPPFYLMMHYVPGRDLRVWSEHHGGAGAIPIETRLEIVAQVGDALSAAHAAGVIHRDIKPSNVLIEGEPSNPGHLKALVTDFGIGQVESAEALAGITRLGFTMTVSATSSSTGTGTHLYMAPELLAGSAASHASDIYSLGVVLYQLLVGDLNRPLTIDWRSDITDPLHADDIERCVSGNPSRRFLDAAELARSLRSYSNRKRELEVEKERVRQRERAAYRRGLLRASAFAASLVAMFALLAAYAVNRAREAVRERGNAENANTRLVQQLDRARASEIDRLVEDGPRDQLLALLADSLRFDPANQVAKARVMAALGEDWLLPMNRIHIGSWNQFQVTADALAMAVIDPRGRATVWDLQSGRSTEIDIPGRALGVGLLKEGRSLVIQTDNGSLIRDLDSGTERMLSPPGVDSKLLGIGADHLILVQSSTNLVIWDAASGQSEPLVLRHSNSVVFAESSLDGTKALTGTASGTISVWSLVAPSKPLWSIHETGSIQTARIASSGRVAITLSGDWLRGWDLQTGKQVAEKKLRSGVQARLSPDGSRCIWIEDRNVTLWQTFESKGVLLQQDSPVRVARFDPDGLQIVTLTDNGRLTIWDGLTGEQLSQRNQDQNDIESVEFVGVQNSIVTLTRAGLVVRYDARSTETPFLPFKSVQGRFKNPFHADGKAVLTGNDYGKLYWLDLDSGSHRSTVYNHGGLLFQAAQNAASHRLAVASGTEVQVFALDSGQPVEAFKPPMSLPSLVVTVEFSPDGALLGAACREHARIWDVKSGNAVGPELRHENPVTQIAFSPAGKLLATASGREARLWELGATQAVARLVHEGGVLSLEFDRDGSKLLTSSSDRSCSIWSIEEQRPLVQFQGHSDWVRSASFDTEGTRVVTASDDGTVRLWDAVSGKQLLPPMRHEGYVLFARMSPDKTRIISGAISGRLRVWSASTGQLIQSSKVSFSAIVSGAFDPSGTKFVFFDAHGRGGVVALPDWPRPDDRINLDWLSAVSGRQFDNSGAAGAIPLGAALDALTNSQPSAIFAQRLRRIDDLGQTRLLPAHDLTYYAAIGALGTDWGVTELLKALRAMPSHPRALDALVNHLLTDFKPGNHAHHARFDALTSRRVKDTGTIARARFEVRIGQYQEAAERLDRARDSAASLPEYWLALAQARVGLIQAEQALNACNMGLKCAESLPSTSQTKKGLLESQVRALLLLNRPREAGAANLKALGLPARNPNATPDQLDLSPYYNANPSQTWHPESNMASRSGNDLAEFPLGLYDANGTLFDARGVIQLGSSEGFEAFPESVQVPVGRKISATHFLHASGFANNHGVTVGRVTFLYSDQSRRSVDLVYGPDITDWWTFRQDAFVTVKTAWSGKNSATAANGLTIKLYQCTKLNPRPDMTVESIHYASTMTRTAPFILGITVE